MPEHVHLLISEPRLHSLSTTISVLKGETSKLLKATRTQFWQTRYYDFNVFTHPKFAEKIEYIHRNPVARGLVDKPENWQWSSFNHWATGEIGPVEVESHWTWTRRERATTPPIAIPPR
jgi:putative transposase